MSALYSSVALCAETGATYRQVHYWTEQGYLKIVRVKGESATGTGSRRIYEESEVRVARALVQLGNLEAIARAVRQALSGGQGHVPGTSLTLISTPVSGAS